MNRPNICWLATIPSQKTSKLPLNLFTFREKSTLFRKVVKILNGSLDMIPSPSPSVKKQIMGGKVCLRCKKTKHCWGIVNKLLKTKSLMTSSSNVLTFRLFFLRLIAQSPYIFLLYSWTWNSTTDIAIPCIFGLSASLESRSLKN